MEFAKTWRIPAALLAVMFVLMLGSAVNDSLTMDELAHIPAGYSYVKLFDYRLNPEHPPLVKALAGLPLLFLDLKFPTNVKSWAEDINGQWTQGSIFIFESGNNPEELIFWARLPMILLTILLGAVFYWWTRKNFGRRVAIIALVLFAFSPTILAHGRLVTTDIGATLGFLIGIVTFLRFLESPTWKNTALAGIVFGIAQLLKYSVFLLVPVYGILLVAWALAELHLSRRERLRLFVSLAGKTVVIGAIGIVIISLVYAPLTMNYPVERQLSDSTQILQSFGNRELVNLQYWLVTQPITRPFAHYLLGLLMVIQRAAGGNDAYFLGEVSSAGSRLYFPLLYLLKEPLVLHILTLAALGLALVRVWHVRPWSAKRLGYWIHNNFIIFASLFFVLFYWAYSMRSPLNIGVRHVLPTFPFIYLLVSREIAGWLRGTLNPTPANWREWIVSLYKTYLAPIPRYIVLAAIFIWFILGALLSYPNFISYYNELGGGTTRGYRIAVDSNYDWGQDLKRLVKYVKDNNIQKINLDFFGGASPRYYLGDKFEPWRSARGAPPAGEYFAISATFLQGALGQTAPGFRRRPEDSYSWLRGYEPVERAGYSIFIYKLPE